MNGFNSRARTTSSALAALSALSVLVALLPTPARADILLQTATLGPTNTIGGLVVSAPQYPAARFQIAQQYTLTSVQVHAVMSPPSGGNGLVFAAIVPLLNMSDFPDGGDLALIADDNPVEVHLFSAPPLSAVVTIPFTSLLSAGTYGVVFGSGEFGATGNGALPRNSIVIEPDAYFGKFITDQWSIHFPFREMYIVVNGEPTGAAAAAPEPGSCALLALGLLGFSVTVRRRRHDGVTNLKP